VHPKKQRSTLSQQFIKGIDHCWAYYDWIRCNG
jgi:hypothetical protein